VSACKRFEVPASKQLCSALTQWEAFSALLQAEIDLVRSAHDLSIASARAAPQEYRCSLSSAGPKPVKEAPFGVLFQLCYAVSAGSSTRRTLHLQRRIRATWNAEPLGSWRLLWLVSGSGRISKADAASAHQMG
jgi:hypothetical protein